MINYLRLNRDLLYWLLVAPFHGDFFKVGPIFRQMVIIGVRAAPMVALTSLSVGVTLALQAAHSLQQLGAEIYVPDLVMLSILREMGPVLIAVKRLFCHRPSPPCPVRSPLYRPHAAYGLTRGRVDGPTLVEGMPYRTTLEQRAMCSGHQPSPSSGPRW